MVSIHHAVLHILDLTSGVTVFSQKELQLEDPMTVGYLCKHLEKSLANSGAKTGQMHSGTQFQDITGQYLRGEADFISYSTKLAQSVQHGLGRCSKCDATDVLVCDFEEEGVRYLGILLLYNKVAFTHYATQEEDGVRNDIIQYQALLPTPSQKVDSYALVNLQSQEVIFADRKVEVDGQETFLLPDIVVECSSVVSPRETMRIVQKIATKIAEEHGASPAETVSKAKNYLLENAEESDEVVAQVLSRQVFAESPIMQHEFLEAVKDAGVPESTKINREYAIKASRTQKIKTDTGIEISFPVDYFENHEFIEFINNQDGTISIQLNNINKIINK